MSVAIVVAVVAGGGGAIIRYLVSRLLAPKSTGIGWAVLVVNVVGSALGGVVLALAGQSMVSADVQLIVLGGVCGGLTTFSTFSVETIQLLQAGRWRPAVAGVAANLFFGALGCGLGYLLTTALLG